MTPQLVVSGALANCGPDSRVEDLLDLLVDGRPEVKVYRRVGPEQRGAVAAALDWQAILGTGADLIAYGSLLWLAYERLVKPKLQRHKQGPSPFLFVTVRAQDGSFTHFEMGPKYESEEAFARDFVEKASAVLDIAGPSNAGDRDPSAPWVRYRRDDRAKQAVRAGSQKLSARTRRERSQLNAEALAVRACSAGVGASVVQ